MSKPTPHNTEVEYDCTNRGFRIMKFRDRYESECSLQVSSLATQACVWFGVDDAKPQRLVPGKGWTPVDFPKDTLFTTRMHLTVAQVKTLLPMLLHFADTGELPDAAPPPRHECGCLVSEAEIIAKAGYWKDSKEELPFCTTCQYFLPRDDYQGQIKLRDEEGYVDE